MKNAVVANPDGRVVEVIELELNPQRREDFCAVLSHALEAVQRAPGYLGHTFGPWADEDDKFFLLIRWTSLGAHVRDFRSSAAFGIWRSRLAGHHQGSPTVRHFHLTQDIRDRPK